MGITATIGRLFRSAPKRQLADQIYPWQWKPISSAPSGKYLLLGWQIEAPIDGISYLIETGELDEGRWIDGPGPQPDFWMDELPYYRRKPMSSAPSGETIIVGWDFEEDGKQYYDFDVTELLDGEWVEGPIQPDWWMYSPSLPDVSRSQALNH